MRCPGYKNIVFGTVKGDLSLRYFLFLYAQGTDVSYLEKLHHELSSHPNFVKGSDKRLWSVEFGEKYSF